MEKISTEDIANLNTVWELPKNKKPIVIIGAGAMGSAFALPCLDNNHDINIVGTHLENEFIDQLKKNDNLHLGLNTKIPPEIKIFKFENYLNSCNMRFNIYFNTKKFS